MAEHTVIMENTLRKLLAEKKYATLREILITVLPPLQGVWHDLDPQAVVVFQPFPGNMQLMNGPRLAQGSGRKADNGHGITG